MVAWAEMSINMGNFTREVNSLKYFSQCSEKTREILEVMKYCLILGIDGYRNAIADWPSWLTDTFCPYQNMHHSPGSWSMQKTSEQRPVSIGNTI